VRKVERPSEENQQLGQIKKKQVGVTVFPYSGKGSEDYVRWFRQIMRNTTYRRGLSARGRTPPTECHKKNSKKYTVKVRV